MLSFNISVSSIEIFRENFDCFWGQKADLEQIPKERVCYARGRIKLIESAIGMEFLILGFGYLATKPNISQLPTYWEYTSFRKSCDIIQSSTKIGSFPNWCYLDYLNFAKITGVKGISSPCHLAVSNKLKAIGTFPSPYMTR